MRVLHRVFVNIFGIKGDAGVAAGTPFLLALTLLLVLRQHRSSELLRVRGRRLLIAAEHA